jgi:endoglucanase
MKTNILKAEIIFFLILALGVSNTIAQSHNYPLAQKLATRFLGAQRCGNTQSWMHGPCHTNDGNAVGRDLTGGWHDCGDYIKFHHVEPYAAIMCLIGYDFYPDAYPDNYTQAYSAPPGNGIPDILDEVKIETDYLIKCVNAGTAYWQVGGQEDHDDFCIPEVNSTLPLYQGGTSTVRPVFSATSGNSNALGNASAALTLMSIAYRPYNATYADLCLTKAVEYYNIAKISPASSNANPSSFYAFNDYQDEMCLAAIMLYRATSTASYLTDATTYANTTKFKNVTDPNYWGNVKWAALMEMYKATNNATYLTMVGTHLSGSTLSACGYYDYSGGGGSGQFEYTAAEAFLSCLYHKATGTASAYTFAKANVDFLLGSHPAISTDAPANFSFMVGYNVLGGGYTKYPQHAPAFGQSNPNTVWTKYAQETATPGSVPFKYVCEGALAGGLTSPACAANSTSYIDNIDNFDTDEVCTGYNAQLIGALAYVNKIVNGSLPVTLIRFVGKRIGHEDQLSWSTAHEEKFDHFEVEQSTDAINFITLGVVNSTGSVTSTANYSFQTSASPGIFFYRLKLVEDDGNYSYSSLICLGKYGDIRFYVYPNPASSEFFIESKTNETFSVSIIDMQGKTLYTKSTQGFLAMESSSLPKGIYIIKLIDDRSGEISLHKIVLQ